MTHRTRSRSFALLVAVQLAIVITSTSAQNTDAASQQRVQRIFAKWNDTTPGCAVGAVVGGQTVLSKAYGMADLEHGVPNTPDTIFEAGSVAKQFTAAAVLLLARDGKLSIDDSVRTYLPELPDYGAPLTIRHMLMHTSGLRDWSGVVAVGGWERGTRNYTQAHVLDIMSRQRSLNFPPGSHYSYSNSGYNLAAIIVSRVSGSPFADFTRERIFAPLGMTHTSWRDDHTRIVANHAIAYSQAKDGFHTDMPFEDAYGNGGLLTTVGDLLKWNENFDSPKVGDAAFVSQQRQVGTLSDGRKTGYAFGLAIGAYKGVAEIGHDGATAGYTADLIRFPDQRISIAVLCNASSAVAPQYAHELGDVYLADDVTPTPTTSRSPSYVFTDADFAAIDGVYRNTEIGTAMRFARDNDRLRLEGSAGGFVLPLLPTSSSHFGTEFGVNVDVDISHRTARVSDSQGSTLMLLDRVPTARPTPKQLKELVGVYSSDEAEATVTIAVEGTLLVFKRRPATTLVLAPTYPDAFSNSQLGTIIFRRDAHGAPAAFSVVQDRVWDLRFTRQRSSRRSSKSTGAPKMKS
jgi:CubicO group peptidase (beta-lactamase class C family)